MASLIGKGHPLHPRSFSLGPQSGSTTNSSPLAILEELIVLGDAAEDYIAAALRCSR
jgi:hypothetical protein